jgi:hypothetical protein
MCNNYQRYPKGLGNVTPWDVYTGRHPEIIQIRKDAPIIRLISTDSTIFNLHFDVLS